MDEEVRNNRHGGSEDILLGLGSRNQWEADRVEEDLQMAGSWDILEVENGALRGTAHGFHRTKDV